MPKKAETKTQIPKQNYVPPASYDQWMVGKAEHYWKVLGPGLTTGAADDDPSGIATYSQAGSQFGFRFLWLSLFTFPLMGVVQEMCARIGLVTGQGLAANIKHHYPRWVLMLCAGLLFIANSFNIGADLGAMAQAVQLIVPQAPFTLLVIGFSLLILFLLIMMPYGKYARYLKWLTIALLSYVFAALMVHLPWSQVLRGTFLPAMSFSREQIFLVTAILGTTISPYLFFWQTSQEVEEEILAGRKTIKSRKLTSLQEIKDMRTDVWSGMFVSNVVMFFIIAACAATLFAHGITDIKTAKDAAEALRPFAGNAATWLFAIGIIGTGLLAVPILAGSASYAISESFGWKEGLYRKLKQAWAFYGVIIISMLAGLIMNFVGLDPIKGLIYAAILNALVAPIVLFLIVRLSSKPKIMGEYVNGGWSKTFGWIVVVVMTVAGLATIISII